MSKIAKKSMFTSPSIPARSLNKDSGIVVSYLKVESSAAYSLY
jgi:hypothetical protein